VAHVHHAVNVEMFVDYSLTYHRALLPGNDMVFLPPQCHGYFLNTRRQPQQTCAAVYHAIERQF
jgi:hypothetical protein